MNENLVPEVLMAEAIELPVENAVPASDELSTEEEAKRKAWTMIIHADGSESRKQWILADFRVMHGKTMQRSHIVPTDESLSPFDKLVFPNSPAFSEEERKSGARVEANFSKRCLEEFGEVKKDTAGHEYQTITDATLKDKKDYFKVWPVVTERGLLQYSIGLPGEELSTVEDW